MVIFVALRLLFVSIAFAVFLLPRPVPADDLPVVRVATPAIDSGAQPFFADAMGFFKQAGINVEITKLNSGAAIAAAVAGGAVDIGQSSLISVATAHERGVPVVVIAGCNMFDARLHQNAMVVAANSSLREPRDLIGKTVAVNALKNITQIGADAWLDRGGVSDAQVRFAEMPFGVMADAIAAGRIDAAVMAQPELGDALATKNVRVLSYPYESIAKDFLIAGWFANTSWAKTHPDLVKRFAVAMALAGTWANKHPDESAKILAQVSGVPALAGGPRLIYATSLDPAAIQPLIDVAAKFGALKASFPASDMIAAPR